MKKNGCLYPFENLLTDAKSAIGNTEKKALSSQTQLFFLTDLGDKFIYLPSAYLTVGKHAKKSPKVPLLGYIFFDITASHMIQNQLMSMFNDTVICVVTKVGPKFRAHLMLSLPHLPKQLLFFFPWEFCV